MTSWYFLTGAIVCEVIGTSFMKLSNGLSRFWPTVLMFLFYGIGFVGLAVSLKQIKVSVAYAIWAGMGIVLITLIDMVVFKTDLGSAKLFAISLIVVGSVILKVVAD